MNTTTLAHAALDGHALGEALLTGAQRVVEAQESLNRINVFPVADGDTGTNLALTLVEAQKAVVASRDPAPGTVLARVADAVLDGARGNSGAIMAQFFQGLADAVADRARLTPQHFATAVQLGEQYAREALADPREGTILSVMTAFARALSERLTAAAQADFPQLLTHGLDAARTALKRTQQELDVLRQAGVVDAGAKGFVAWIEGLLDYLRDGVVTDPGAIVRVDAGDDAPLPAADQDLEYRYCTECIVTAGDIDRRKLREALSTVGGSLVLAGTKRKAKIHIHVNEPEAAFRIARQFGSLSAEKADDMHRQQRTAGARDRGVAVITDSAADIPEAELERLDIHVVPLRVHFGAQAFLDKVSINGEEFFHELATNPEHPQTSQPSPGDFRRQYQYLASHFDDVLSISLTGTVSGTLRAAETAAARVQADGAITVIDTLNASTGQGLLAIDAAEAAQAGASADSIRARLAELIPVTRSFALLADLSYAVRGGRVPASRKFMADVLRLNPVLSTRPDGRIAADGVLLGRGRRVAKFARYIARRAGTDVRHRLAISHGDCPDDAAHLADLLGRRLDLSDPPYIAELGAAIGVHGGPGTLVASIQARPA